MSDTGRCFAVVTYDRHRGDVPDLDVTLFENEDAAKDRAIEEVRDRTEETDWDDLSVAAVREYLDRGDPYQEGDFCVAVLETGGAT